MSSTISLPNHTFTGHSKRELSGDAKMLCILHHWGVQLILAYSWARPAIFVVGKGRGGMFLFLLFLHLHSCSSFFLVPLFHLLYSLFSLFSLSLGDDTKWPSRVDVSLNPNTVNSPLSGEPVLCKFFRQKLTTACLESAEGKVSLNVWAHG